MEESENAVRSVCGATLQEKDATSTGKCQCRRGGVSKPYAPPESTLRVWADRTGAVREGSGVRCFVNAFLSLSFQPCFPVDFRPFVPFSDYHTQNLYGQKISFAFQMLIFEVHGFVLGWIFSVFRFFVVSLKTADLFDRIINTISSQSIHSVLVVHNEYGRRYKR